MFPLVASMRRNGIPLTRENYILQNWGAPVPDDQWTPEHEMELPPHLRDGATG